MSSHQQHDDHGQHNHLGMMMTIMTTTVSPTINSDNNLVNHNHHHNHGSSQQQDESMMMMTTGSMDHMGKMYFHLGYEPIVLFQQWSAESNLSMFMTCLFFFMMAILYEILKAYRRIFSVRLVRFKSTPTNTSINVTSVQIMHNDGNDNDGGSSGRHGGTNRSDSVELKCDIIDNNVNPLDQQIDKNFDSSSQMAKFNHPSYGMRSTTLQSPLDNESGGGSSSHDSNNSNTICHHASSVNPILTFNNPNTTIPLFATIKEMFSPMNIYSTFLYSLQVLFAYYLMLAFMLFNIWICLAILAGAAIGHFILAERNQALTDHIVEDYCH
ncbi:hypothetical protein DERP_012243 [Dermatophagoides pteronyssinus]|uniref:Copper transport protein n=2 Tax=Dermatophagoides pteronyssinus TaxID=6956 RepID=A0A6P6YI00_DERPT|nr:uncharacterized protein LOC113798743 [Dermatophagoides pteronyssinus]XP_027205235.1 uncharacterized protein LOC113798743 [Dermatophagoides pteronyssinus]KAH9421511.1 hypothetical protein DERP_012243 [Dermatophagoides pteronyssinus]